MTDSNLSGAITGKAPEKCDAVAIRNLHFRWPGDVRDTLAIDELTVHAGEQVFLRGASGSGKTTLLSLMAGILTPTAGELSVNGSDFAKMSAAERDVCRGDSIGVIFQQFNLIPYLSITENVLLPTHFSAVRRERAGDTAKSRTEEAQALLTRLDMPEALWSRPVNRLSVGQQQRVAAARALIGRPPLLIADEPTSALDEERRMMFLKLLMEESARAGSALVFVSHDRQLQSAFARTVEISDINRAAAGSTAEA